MPYKIIPRYRIGAETSLELHFRNRNINMYSEYYIPGIYVYIYMENRPVHPGSIQGSHRPISFMRIKYRTRANDLL